MVQYHFVEFLAEHLTDCRKSLGGDLDDLMVLAMLGQRDAKSRQDGDARQAGATEHLSALRISDATGIPRESVRRKLNRLAARGWVAHDPERGWVLVGSVNEPTAKIDLADFDRRGIERLGKLITALLPLVAEQQSLLPSSAGESA